MRPNRSSASSSSCGRSATHRADSARRREQLGGLCLDHLEIGGLGRLRVVLRHQLQHLALGDDRGGARQDFENAQRAVGDHQLEGAAEQKIADEDRRLVAPHGVGGIAAAAQVARIDDIVVQQGRGVDEFDGRGERDVPAAAVSAEPGAAQGQHRAQPLSAARDDMAGELRDQRHRALHAIDDQPVDAFEVASEKPGQRVERRFVDRLRPIDTRPERHRLLLPVPRAPPNGRPIELDAPRRQRA